MSRLSTLPVLALISVLSIAAGQCAFCLPACTQPPFPGDLCGSSVVVSLKARIISNSSTVCTNVCDGKGIALGNLKTVYVLMVEKIFKNPAGLIIGSRLSVAGTTGLFTSDPKRLGVRMEVGKTYFINLKSPMNLPGISHLLYVDRCDHPDLYWGLTAGQRACLHAGNCC